jgi:hypothetical protein
MDQPVKVGLSVQRTGARERKRRNSGLRRSASNAACCATQIVTREIRLRTCRSRRCQPAFEAPSPVVEFISQNLTVRAFERELAILRWHSIRAVAYDES